ncbi:hypothetical protein NDU88_004137 [Pleurodeles waltl]|uniref:Uncharacterized protein n=1 Tax=Pleurodeles waltl TaxID=8319 RepID=A0AAV7T7X8_PLEWA|nr:hypothetical protein NDU88_004137 [Pleurodeles waltl]
MVLLMRKDSTCPTGRCRGREAEKEDIWRIVQTTAGKQSRNPREMKEKDRLCDRCEESEFDGRTRAMVRSGKNGCGVFRYLGGRFPRKNKNKVAAGGVFRYLGGRFPRKNKNKVAAGKWGG